MTFPRLIVADNLRPPIGSGAPRSGAPAPEYEPGHSERQVHGAITVSAECRWLATLAVPMTGDQSVLLTLAREGPTAPGAPTIEEVSIVVPPGEVDALVTLLRGLVAHARSASVLSRPSRR